MTPLTDAVIQKINALFSENDRPMARKLIEEKCGSDLPLTKHMGSEPSGFDRVRFAVLKLSDGDLVRLDREIAGAHYDWRDTLMSAEFGHDVQAHLKWNPKTKH